MSITVRILGDDSDLQKTLGDSTKQLAKYGAAAAAAGAAAATALTVQGLKAVDAQAKLARSLDTSIDSLRALQIAASDSGLDGMDASLKRLNRRLGAAEMGMGEAGKSVEALNLNLAELSDMDADERIAAIADAVRDSGVSMQQAARHAQNLGFEQAEAAAFFQQGGDAIRSYRQEVQDLGLALSDVDAAKVEMANDAFSRFGLLLDGVKQQLAVQVAPLLTAVSRLMVDSAKDAGGLGEATADTFNMIIEGAAEGVNAIAKMDRQFLRTKAALDIFALEVRNGFLEIAREIVEIPTGAVNELIGMLNKVGADIEPMGLSQMGQGVQSAINSTMKEVRTINAELQDELSKPLPGDQFKRFVFEAREAAEKAAIELQSVEVPAVGGGQDDGGRGQNTPGSPKDEERLKREEEKRKERLEKIQEAFDQEFMLTEEFNERMIELDGLFRDSKTTSDDEYQQARLDKMREFFNEQYGIASSGYDALGNLAAKHWNAETAMAVDALGHIVNAFAGESRKMFEIQKAAGIANAIVSTYTGMSKALELGWPLGPIAAASIAAKGFANVAAIKSQSFNGGGGSAGGSGGGSTTQNVNAQTQPVERREQTVANVTLQGDMFSRDSVKGLMEQMNDLSEDGMRLRVI